MHEQLRDYPVPEELRIMDCHVHIFHWEDGQSSGAQNYIHQLKRFRELYGFDSVNVVCVPFGKDRDISQNIMGALLKLSDSRFYVHAGLMYPQTPVKLPFAEGIRPEQQLEDILAVGFDGIKILETKPNYRKILDLCVADPEMDRFFTKAEETQTHIIWHVNDPLSFWDPATPGVRPEWRYTGNGFMQSEDIYQEVFRVLQRHPNLKITFAHLFFMENDPDRLVRLLDTYPNVCVDLTPHARMYPAMTQRREVWKSILTRYSDRFLFGTDHSSAYPHDSLYGNYHIYRFLLSEDRYMFCCDEPVQGLGLDLGVVQKILCDNFYRRVGSKPKTICRSALKAYLHKYLPMMCLPEQKEQIVAFCASQNLL